MTDAPAVWTGDVHGVPVRSDLACFDLAPAEGADDHAVTIRLGDVPERLERVVYDRLCVQADAHQLLVRVPGTGRFLARGGREVVAAPAPGAPPAHVRLHLEQTVWPGVLQQRGRLVLQGSAVAIGDGAVVLAGPAGSGASTLAAALLVRHGFAVLADGVCPLAAEGDGQPRLAVAPGPDLLLWRHALRRLGLPVPAASAVHPAIDKHRVVPDGAGPASGWRPVRAVLLLGAADDARRPALVPVREGSRVTAVRDAMVRPERAAVLHPGAVATFAALVAVADRAVVTRVARRWYPWAVEDLADAVAGALA